MSGVIIFGVSGMLGRYVYLVFKQANMDVLGLNRTDFDVLKDGNDKLKSILENNKHRYKYIINCIGIIPQKVPLDQTDIFMNVNTEFPIVLSKLCKTYTYNFIHITTDCVYDGLIGKYDENAEKTETNSYGVSKIMGEMIDATVIRTSIIGDEINSSKSLLSWVKNSKGTINGYSNHLWNGVTCLMLAEIILLLIHKGILWVGIRHIFSPRDVSKYELCKYINEEYNLGLEVKPFQTEKSIDKTLRSIYLNTLGTFIIPDIKEQIKLQQQFDNIVIN